MVGVVIGSWFPLILEEILAIEEQISNRENANSSKLDKILALELQNQQALQALTTLEQQNAKGIQQILQMLTPPVPTQFKAKVSTP